jgi:hypothetical protein
MDQKSDLLNQIFCEKVKRAISAKNMIYLISMGQEHQFPSFNGRNTMQQKAAPENIKEIPCNIRQCQKDNLNVKEYHLTQAMSKKE